MHTTVRSNNLIHLIGPITLSCQWNATPTTFGIVVWVLVNLGLFFRQWDEVPNLLKQFRVLGIDQEILMHITNAATVLP